MKINFLPLLQMMPVLTAPACDSDDCITQMVFPATASGCVCETAQGGINELYFIPCTETMSEANLLLLTWWTGLLGDPDADPVVPRKLGRSGMGLGSIGKKGDTRARVASCRPEQLTSITWALKFRQLCFDKTSARTTCEKMNAIINNFNSFLVVARMCDGADTILPIGVFTTSDSNWIVPETSEESQSIEYELSWKELGMPCTLDVPGLSTVLPKLS